jgi:hypothetical protein
MPQLSVYAATACESVKMNLIFSKPNTSNRRQFLEVSTRGPS